MLEDFVVSPRFHDQYHDAQFAQQLKCLNVRYQVQEGGPYDQTGRYLPYYGRSIHPCAGQFRCPHHGQQQNNSELVFNRHFRRLWFLLENAVQSAIQQKKDAALNAQS